MIRTQQIRVPLDTIRRADSSVGNIMSETVFENWFGFRIVCRHENDDYTLEFRDQGLAVDFILRYGG